MKYLQQFAALPLRRSPEIEILLITSRETKRWIIPKGWPMEGYTDAEGAAQEAFEEAGIRGSMTTPKAGSYTYVKRKSEGGKAWCKVDVFVMDVEEILDLWPEVHQRRRQWFSPERAAIEISEPEVADIIRAVAADRLGHVVKAPTFLQTVLRQIANVLRLLGLR